MKFGALLPLAVLAILPAALTLNAQTVEQVLVSKESTWVQTSAADPVINPRPSGPAYGGPYFFGVEVQGANLSAITSPTVTLPGGSLYPTQNPTYHHGGVLAYNVGEESWRYGLTGNNYGGTSEAGRDASFAPGSYGLTVLGESFSLNFPAETFPVNTPKVTLTGGAWVGGKYVIDVTHALTITTNAFTNFAQNVDGVMTLEVDGTNDESVADVIVFHSDNPSANNFITYTIPANTLVAGTDYDGEAGFYALTDKRGSFAARLDAAIYVRSLAFAISAVPSPALGVQATLYGVGDVDGGSFFSEVRDATKAGGVIYAVGDTNAQGLFLGADTGFLWTSTTGMVPLPDIVTNTAGNSSNYGTIAAVDISADGAYIASRARAATGGTQRHAVRVTSSGLTNLDLGTLPTFTFSQTSSVSDDGAVLYGLAAYAAGKNRAVRFTASGPTITAIPFLNAGDDVSNPLDRGASADGSVMVGRSANSATDALDGTNGIGPGNRAFRYVQAGGTVAAIPLLPGGTWNTPVAISPNGNLTLVRGDSTSAPQQELYLHNAATGAITAFGTPNGSRGAGGIAGMTADGSVVAAVFVGLDNPNAGTYIHNSHGWHDLESVVTAAGVNLAGWRLNQNIFGISANGTLVWGRGSHNGENEGFVIEFAPGYLAAYTEPATYSTPGSAIVGSWTIDSASTTALGGAALTFFANGYYTIIQTALPADAPSGISGFERGQFTWNATTGALAVNTLIDTSGDYGFSSLDGVSGATMVVTGNTMTISIPNEDPLTATRVMGASPLIGAFGNADVADGSAMVVFLPNGYYYMAQDGDSSPITGDPNGHDGMEWGTYNWNPATGVFTANPTVDTNGQWGFSHPRGGYGISLSSDFLALTLTENSVPIVVSRVGTVIAPAISTQPQPGVLIPGMSKTFSVVASGTGTLAYQWRKNGANIVGATASSYTLASVATGDAGAYSVVVTNYVGSATSDSVTLTVASSINYDFNGDGHPDILLENVVSGQRVLWLMTGPSNQYVALGLDLGVLDATWHIVGMADFDGNEKPDILLENTVSGQRVLWLMGGPNNQYVQLGIDLGFLDPTWHIVALADFNQDERPDILLENVVSGQRVLWLMGGPNNQYVQLGLDLGFLDPVWHIVGVADFNADGAPDILLENTSSGQRVLWLMGGPNSQYVMLGLDLGFLSPSWHIASITDFNADGRPDILLENAVSGQRVLWLMGGPNGAYVTLGLDLGFLDPAWHIVN